MSNYSKRNTVLMFFDAVLFTNAMAFLSINTVIPYFLNKLGASTFVISLASALVGIGTFVTQPLFAKMAMGLRYKLKTFVGILSIQRLFFLAFVFIIPVFAESKPGLMIVLFLICWGLFNLFVGSYSPFYFGLFSKMIPAHRRGRLIGFSGATGNILAFGTAYIIGLLLSKAAFPYNYMVIFGLGTLLLLVDNLDFCFMKEPPDEIDENVTSYFQYIKDIPEVLKNNKLYGKLILSYCFFVVTNISLVYYTLYAIREFNAQAVQIAIFTALAVGVNTLGSVLFGITGDRYGHKPVLKIASACGVVAGIVVLGMHSIIAVYIAFALSSLCACGYMVSGGVLIIQIVPKEKVPVYISIEVMITLLVSSFVTLVSGLLIDTFSFLPVFAITGIAALTTFVVLHAAFSKNGSGE